MSATESERYRALVERSADVIFMLDEHGTVTYANQTAAERVGTPVDALVGQSALDLIHPDDRSRAIEALHRTFTSGPGPKDPFFARVRHADGHWLPVELVGNNLTDDESIGGSSSRCATSRTATAWTGCSPRPRRTTGASSRRPKRACGRSTPSSRRRS